MSLPVRLEALHEFSDGNVRSLVAIPTERKWNITELASVIRDKGYCLNKIYKSSDKGVFTVFMSPLKKLIPFEYASSTQMKTIAKNIFADENDSIWDLVDTASGKVLIKRHEGSASDLLASLKARGEVASSIRKATLFQDTKVGETAIVLMGTVEVAGLVIKDNELLVNKEGTVIPFTKHNVIIADSFASSVFYSEIAADYGLEFLNKNVALFNESVNNMNNHVGVM